MQVSWDKLKDLATSRKVGLTHADNEQSHTILLNENNSNFICIIPKTSPRNDDQVDFEDNYLDDVNKEMVVKSKDLIEVSGTQGALSVGTSAAEVKVGASRFEGRKSVTIYNNSENIIYWGYNDQVTSSTGTPIDESEFAVFKISDEASIYLVAATSGNDVRITEAK